MEQVTLNRDTGTYFRLMNSFLLVQVVELDETLRRNGVVDPKVREDICAQFGLGMGQIFDCGWIAANEKRYYPLLMFSEKFLDNPKESISELGPIEAPPKADEFHPLAVDAATDYFRDLDGNRAKDLYGTVGDA